MINMDHVCLHLLLKYVFVDLITIGLLNEKEMKRILKCAVLACSWSGTSCLEPICTVSVALDSFS